MATDYGKDFQDAAKTLKEHEVTPAPEPQEPEKKSGELSKESRAELVEEGNKLDKAGVQRHSDKEQTSPPPPVADEPSPPDDKDIKKSEKAVEDTTGKKPEVGVTTDGKINEAEVEDYAKNYKQEAAKEPEKSEEKEKEQDKGQDKDIER